MSGEEAFIEVQRLLALEEQRGRPFLHTMSLVNGVWSLVRVNRATGVQDSVEFDPANQFPEDQQPEEAEEPEAEETEVAEDGGEVGNTAMLPGMAPEDDIPQLEPRDGLDDEDDDEDEEEGEARGSVWGFWQVAASPYPFIETVSGQQILHTEGFVIPLADNVEWVICRHPKTGAVYIDDAAQNPAVKPRYLSVLEKRQKAIPRAEPTADPPRKRLRKNEVVEMGDGNPAPFEPPAPADGATEAPDAPEGEGADEPQASAAFDDDAADGNDALEEGAGDAPDPTAEKKEGPDE
eukprot:s1804_g4.t1